VPYSPDELWLYGPHWGESTEFPAGTGLRVIGAPFVTGALSQAPGQETVRDPHRITVLTQGVNGAMLCDFAADLARRLPDYEVVLRLHPNESDADYRARLAAAEAPANLTLSHRDPVLFELLAGTTWQIGVFSTALFDGMMLGARTLVLDAPGAEYMHPVIETGDALSVASAEEAARRLEEAPACTDPARYYAPVPESFPPPVLGRGEGTNAERPDLR